MIGASTMLELLSRASAEYSERKLRAEAAVTIWTWASSNWFDFRALHYERNGRGPGKRLRAEPTKLFGAVHCGLDALGRVVVEREYNAYSFCERFFRWDSCPMEAVLYDSTPTREPINLILAHVDGGLIVGAEFVGSRGYHQEHYVRHEGALVEVHTSYAEIGQDSIGPVTPHEFTQVSYDTTGRLARLYRRNPSHPSYPGKVVFERVDGRIRRARP